MANMTETELRKRLKKLEAEPTASTALVSKVGDQYEYDKDFIYIAYASALANLSSGSISNQSDATDFQLTPYNDSGTLMAYRGYFINKSIYQSGDPTDYTWEATSGTSGYTSSERQYTTSTGLPKDLGNPTKPGSIAGTAVTWTVINAGTAIPTTAVYLAERFTLTTTGGAITSAWDIKPVGKYVDTTLVTADGIKTENIDLDGTLNVTSNSGAIRWKKTTGDDTTNSGVFVGNNSAGDQRIILGTSTSFIYYDGNKVYTVGTSDAASVGTEINIWQSGTQTFDISGLLSTITWYISGGGGGGGGAGGFTGAGYGGNGGTTSIVVKRANGTTRATLGTAAGGTGGAYNSSNLGHTGHALSVPSGFPNPPWSQGSDVGSATGGHAPSGGGGGATTDIPDPDYKGGEGGNAGSTDSGTYTIVDNTDTLTITVGGGGAGSVGINNGGNGANGAAWIQGAT